MNCNQCSSEFSPPDIIDGIAYFVCEFCGNTHTDKNYRVYTDEECIELFERENNLKLPLKLKDYAGKKEVYCINLPRCNFKTTQYYFGDGYYTFQEFYEVQPNTSASIFDSTYLIKEWGLPDNLVLLAGDGHTWLALDYRHTRNSPEVIVIESDKCQSLVVSKNFDEFIDSLVLYVDVYGEDDY